MTISLTVLIAYISAILLFLATPGPVTVMVANTSAKQGFKMGLATIAGTNTASLILISLAFAVIFGLIAINQYALLWLTLFGSLYILYFAIGLLKDKISLQPTDLSTLNKNYLQSFQQGFIIGISNPKDVLFFVAFFPLFFNISDDKILSMGLLTSIWIVMDYVILSLYALIFSRIKNTKTANLINRLSAMVLSCVALYAIYMTSVKLWFAKKTMAQS